MYEIVKKNDSPIQSLVEREKNMQQLDVELPIKINFSNNGKIVQIIHNEVTLNAKVERPLIHQLGGRAWGKNQEFRLIADIWRQKFTQNRAQLEEELEAVFRSNDLSIRYEINAKGENLIYGIVTPHFVDVNQLEFRKKFIEQNYQSTTLIPESYGFKSGVFGEIIEYFKFYNPGFQTEFRYGLVYARNNGYEAYRVNWERYVLICQNGLKGWVGNNLRWNHTKKIDLGDFILKTVADGIGNQKFLEERISICRDMALNKDKLAELISRLSLAQSSKARINDRLAIEYKQVGCNEWALIQSLTWLGSHEKAIPQNRKQELISLGTDVLEFSLDEVLKYKPRTSYDSSYGLVLPKISSSTEHI